MIMYLTSFYVIINNMVDAFECHNVYQFIGPESHYVSKLT